MEKFVVLLTKRKWPRMNGKMTTLTFFSALFTVYKKLGQFFFHTLQANLFKQRYILFIY